MFANMKEGAKIVSSKAFCPLNFRITDRNLSGKAGTQSLKQTHIHLKCLKLAILFGFELVRFRSCTGWCVVKESL